MTRLSQITLNIYALVFVLVYMPIPMPGQIGAYNPNSRLYVCFDRQTCLHEQGHRLDQSLDWPSRTPEFELAATDYIVAEFSGAPSVYAIHVMNILLTRKSYSELYADIWMWASGDPRNIPAQFRSFYDA